MSPQPTSIGRFTIHSRLGKGGMGVVYLARDPDLDRFVAVKLLRVTDEEVRERFLREARTTGRLQHPNIVTTFERGEHDGHPFIAMEYVSGETLAEIIGRRAQLTVERKVELIRQLCAGLSYAHQAGIIHRDIKPANLMVSREGGLLKILDFGIARLADGSGTMVGMVLGTPAYMSPEQIQGEAVGIRSDVFSVGAVLYELLVYRKAFGGDNQTQVQQRILNATDDVCSGLGGVVSADLERVLRRALARNIEDRYPDLGAMDADLAAASTVAAPDQWDATVIFDRRGEIARRRALQIEGHLTRTRSALDQRDFTAAHDAVEAALVLDPENADAQTLMTRIEQLEVDESVAASLQAARHQFDAGDLSEAIRRVDEALRSRPHDPEGEALKRTVEVAVVQRERERAEARAIADSLTHSRDALQAGAFERAVRAADEVLAFDADHAEALDLKTQATTEIETRREHEAREQHAHDEVDAARVEFESGEQTNALRRLEQFDPPHPLVSDALDELRHEARERHARGEVDAARVEFESGEQTGALRRLEQFDPPHPLVSDALQELQQERAVQEKARLEEERQRQEEAERRSFDAWVEEQTVALRSAVAEKRLDDADGVLGELRAKGRPIPSLDALEASVRTARHEADAERIAGMLVEARTHLESDDFAAASDAVERALEVDVAHAGALSLRSDIAQARARAEAEQREAAVAEALARATEALSAEDFEAARGHCTTLLTAYPSEPRATALLAKIRKSRRAAALRGVRARVGRIGDAARESGEAIVSRVKGITRRGSTVSGKKRVPADTGGARARQPGPVAVVAGAAVVAAIGLVAVFLLVLPERTDVDPGQVTRFLEAGELVSAAELIEEALSVEPEHEAFQSLAGRLRDQVEQGVAGPRAAAQEASDALLGPPRAAETEAIRLWTAGDLVPAVNAYAEAARLYLDAELAGADLDDLVARARSVLTGVWADGRYFGGRQLEAAVPYLDSARNRASEDIAVGALVEQLWDIAAAHVQRAQEAAEAAGFTDLSPFAEAVDLQTEAQRLHEGGDVSAAVASAVRSAALFGDARAQALLLGRVYRALERASESFSAGELVEAVTEVQVGRQIVGRNPALPAPNQELLSLRGNIVDAAENDANSAKAGLSPGTASDEGDALLQEANDAVEGAEFVRGVTMFVAAAAAFRDVGDLVANEVEEAIVGIEALLRGEDLAGAARRAEELSNQGVEPHPRALEIVGVVRRTAERLALEAKTRAAGNQGHAMYENALEQEAGAGRAEQLVDAVRFYGNAERLYDEVTAAEPVQVQLERLLEGWKIAFENKDWDALTVLYPEWERETNLRGWLEDRLNVDVGWEWAVGACSSLRPNAENSWQTTCAITVTHESTAYPETDRITIREVGGVWEFDAIRPQ